ARADAAVVRALRGLPTAAGRGGARHHGRRHDGPRLDPVRAAGDGVRAPGRDREPALQVRRGPARGVARGGLLGERRARAALPARPHGHQLPARARGLLLRLSDQAARVPGALPRVVPARRREPGGDDPAGRGADAAFGGAVKKDIALYGRVLRYLGPYGGLIAAAVVATLGFALTDAFSLVMLIPFLNALFGDAPLNVGGGQDALEWVLNHTVGYWIRPDAEPQQVLLSVILFILAVVLLKNVFDFFQAYLVVRLEQGVTRDLRNQVYGHLLDLDLRFFGRTRTGQIISRLTSDADQLRSMVTRNIAKLATSVFQVVATLAALIAISLELTLIAIVVLPAMFGIWGRMVRRLRRADRGVLNLAGEVAAHIQETLGGIRLVKASAAEDFERDRFRSLTRAYYKHFVRTERLRALAGPLTETMAALGTVLLLWYGSRMVLVEQSLEGAAFMTFLVISLRLYSPVKWLSKFPSSVQPGLAAAERLFEFLDTPVEMRDAPGAREFTGFRERIRFEGVSFAYVPGEPVLEDISFEVAPGEVVALVGPSGAGKTTLVDLLARFYDPTSGRITVDGVDLRELSLHSLRSHLGIVTQDTVLFHD